MADSLTQLDHPYIDEHRVAERYVAGSLSANELKLFQLHYVDCEECLDRVALARLFQSGEAPPVVAKPPRELGLFNLLGTFPPRIQTLIFAASALALLLMPIVAMTWLSSRAAPATLEPEVVILLQKSSAPIEVSIPSGANWVSISTMGDEAEPQGTYRLSVVDVADRPVWVGPDQRLSKGTALAIRVPSLPTGISFVLVERRAANGAYSVVSRHSLVADWR